MKLLEAERQFVRSSRYAPKDVNDWRSFDLACAGWFPGYVYWPAGATGDDFDFWGAVHQRQGHLLNLADRYNRRYREQLAPRQYDPGAA